jgi:cation transport ATPase
VGRRSRKRRPGEAAASAPRPEPRQPREPSRSERKEAEARAALVSLEEGERPLAVTIGAIATIAVVVANIVVYAAGVEVQGDRPAAVSFFVFAAVMLTMAWGLWHARYWAVLGLQALLALLILIVSLVALKFQSVLDVVICVGILAPSMTLFYFLIKAMARIQMPERPG